MYPPFQFGCAAGLCLTGLWSVRGWTLICCSETRGFCHCAFIEYENMIGDAMRIQNTVFDVNFVALEEIWRGTSAGRPQQRAQDAWRCGHALAPSVLQCRHTRVPWSSSA